MSNIAEGSGRNSDADFGHFLEIAYGSLMEVVSQLFVALDENYIAQEQFDAIAQEADHLAGKIVNLSKSLGRTARFTNPRLLSVLFRPRHSSLDPRLRLRTTKSLSEWTAWGKSSVGR